LAAQLFFGREDESKQLFYLIVSESLTVLYSKSGYGKTSLLHASVFRMLREDNFFPFTARFNKKDASPCEAIRHSIQNTKQAEFDVISNEKEGDLLSFFQGLEIWSAANKLLTPVVMLDQFEELFTLEHNLKHRASFVDQLAALLFKAKEGKLSVRIVISIREDFLGHLEKMAIKIPSIFSNRFRLEALTKSAAAKAIVKPGAAMLDGVEFSSPPRLNPFSYRLSAVPWKKRQSTLSGRIQLRMNLQSPKNS
jgi:AAA+ ATPase superfamily predicted ATPase